MKKLILIITICLLNFACTKGETEIFNSTEIRAVTPEQVSNVKTIQLSAILTNINTRNEYRTSDFKDGVLKIKLQKGYYNIKIEGNMSYVSQNGETVNNRVRAYVELAEFITENDYLDVQLFIML